MEGRGNASAVDPCIGIPALLPLLPLCVYDPLEDELCDAHDRLPTQLPPPPPAPASPAHKSHKAGGSNGHATPATPRHRHIRTHTLTKRPTLHAVIDGSCRPTSESGSEITVQLERAVLPFQREFDTRWHTKNERATRGSDQHLFRLLTSRSLTHSHPHRGSHTGESERGDTDRVEC